MRARLKLKPGQNGTKKLAEKYGKSLVCVRYRYDEINQKRYKTVELIIDEIDWKPKKIKYGMKDIVYLQLEFREFDLHSLVRAAGGVWNKSMLLWEVRYDTVVSIGLEERVLAAKSKYHMKKKHLL